MASQPIVHVEIPATNTAAASKFYADAFGWQIEHDQQFDYYMWAGQGGPGGGFVTPEHGYKLGEVIVYVQSEDVDADLKKIESLGGKVLQAKTEIPGTGYFAFFADPSGNKMGLFGNK